MLASRRLDDRTFFKKGQILNETGLKVIWSYIRGIKGVWICRAQAWLSSSGMYWLMIDLISLSMYVLILYL